MENRASDARSAANGHGTSSSFPTMPLWRQAVLALSLFFLHVLVRGETAHAAHTCTPKELQTLSCSPESLTTNACCVESPGGLLLHTQLYNWNPGLGPKDSWTIHGLWSDYCNGMTTSLKEKAKQLISCGSGSYPSSCDPSRAYTNLPEIFEDYDLEWLLAYFNQFWKARVTSRVQGQCG